MSDPLPRRLAAIVAVDAVGFSAQIELDEPGTLAELRTLETDLLQPTLEKYGGRLFKSMGDGFLYEFPSVVHAVEASVTVQEALAARDTRLLLRIGIHLGDVVASGDDLLGDGVNVAARIEGQAQHGGLSLSDDAYRQVQGKLNVPFTDGGPQQLKNLNRPIRIWHWSPAASIARATAPTAVVKPSIAVLAFSNMSGDPEQEYFADGLVEDITTALSRSRLLFVASRSSSFSYRDRNTDLRTIARELGVRYVIEGSVRRSGSRLRVTAQLIEAEPDTHVWAERYDRELTDLFEIQDEITQSISGAVGSEVTTAEQQRVSHRKIVDLGAWERHMKAMWRLQSGEAEATAEAQEILETEIVNGTANPATHALLSWALSFDLIWGLSGRPPAVLIKRAVEAGRTAVTLDPQDEMAHACLALTMWLSGDHEAAISEARAAIRLNPNYVMGHATLGYALGYSVPENLVEATLSMTRAMELGPRDHLLRWTLTHQAVANFVSEDYAQAEILARRALEQDPHLGSALRTLAVALAFQGREAEASEAWQRASAAHPIDLGAFRQALLRMFARQEDAERFVTGLTMAGASFPPL